MILYTYISRYDDETSVTQGGEGLEEKNDDRKATKAKAWPVKGVLVLVALMIRILGVVSL